MEELNNTDSVPSDVIANLYQNVSKESELGSGDIRNIIDVLNVALVVQYDRQSCEFHVLSIKLVIIGLLLCKWNIVG